MENNRRQYERVSTSQPTIVIHNDTEDMGKMIDISQKGSGILANSLIDEGESILLKFTLPTSMSQTPFEIVGKVVHSRKVQNQYLMGILFTQIDSAHEYAIREYVARHHKMQY